MLIANPKGRMAAKKHKRRQKAKERTEEVPSTGREGSESRRVLTG
jgi:hypothetical protein